MRNKVQEIRFAIEAALKPLEVQYSFKVSQTKMTYSPDGAFTLKVEGGVVSADGKVASKEAGAFAALATLYGFKAEDLGATFKWNGQAFTITGIKSRAHKRPLLAKHAGDGKLYTFPIDAVLVALGRPVRPALSLRYDSVRE